MEKRVKGLVALLLAVILLAANTLPAYAQISDEIWSKKSVVFCNIYTDVSSTIEALLASEADKGESSVSLDGKTYLINETGNPFIGESFQESINVTAPTGYQLTGYRLWETSANNTIAASGAKYLDVTGTDIMTETLYREYTGEGAIKDFFGEYWLYGPVIEPLYEAVVYDVPVKDENGDNIQTLHGTLTELKKMTLEAAEGTLGWYVTFQYKDRWGNTYTPTYLVPDMTEAIARMSGKKDVCNISIARTKTIPVFYCINPDTPLQHEGYPNSYGAQTVRLEPGKSVNSQLTDVHKDYYTTSWKTWKLNGSGKLDKVSDFNANTSSGISFADWKTLCYNWTKEIDSVSGCDYPLLEAVYTPKDYTIPVYDRSGAKTDSSVTLNTENYATATLPTTVGNNGWELRYGTKEPVTVTTASEIWTKGVTVIGGTFDVTNAGLYAICDHSDNTSDTGTITKAATLTTTGTKTYRCTQCNKVIRTEEIPVIVLEGTTVQDNVVTITASSDWNTVEDAVELVPTGAQIEVTMDSTGELPASTLTAIKGKDVDLVIDMGNGIKWSVNGTDVTSPKAVDLRLTTGGNAIPSDLVKKVAGADSKTMQMSLNYDGDFGFKATLSVTLGAENNGLWANLFYHNPEKGLEFMGASKITDGMADMLFTHASDYVIVMDTKAYENTTSGDTTVKPTDTTAKPTDTTQTATTAQTTAAQTAASVTSPKTGDVTPVVSMVLLLIASMGALGMTVVVSRKKREK